MGNTGNWFGINQSRLSRRAVLRGSAVGAVGLAGAALIGCSSGKGAPTAAGTAVQGTATAVVQTKTARRGGTLRIAGQLSGDVPGLDADRVGGSAMGSIVNITGVKLVQWDERPNSPGPVENVIPDLAESWETPDQGLTWNFKLRKGVKTSDGLEVKASDVVWTLERGSAMKTPVGNLQNNFPDLYTGKKPNATAIDDYLLQIKIPKPDADALSLLGQHTWTVEHKEVITKKGADLGKTAPGYGDVTAIDQIRGGGPYYPTEYVPASGFKLKRNPNFYDKDIAYLDGIDHPLILDPSAAAAALQAEQLDAFGPLSQFTIQQGLELQKANNLQVYWEPCMVWNPWIYDQTQAPFNDVRVRQAISRAIDRESWIKNLYSGRGRNGAMVLPWLTYWALDPAKMGEDAAPLKFDPAESKKLLQAAGLEKFSFPLQTSNIGAYTVTYPYADLMKSMLATVGVTMDTKIVEYASHLRNTDAARKGVYQSFIVRPDIQTYAFAQVGGGGSLVAASMDTWGALKKNDKEYQAFLEVMDKQRLTQDRNARRELIYDMQRRMAKNQWNFYWPSPDSAVVSNKKVHNFRPPPGWNWNIMKYVWKDA